MAGKEGAEDGAYIDETPVQLLVSHGREHRARLAELLNLGEVVAQLGQIGRGQNPAERLLDPRRVLRALVAGPRLGSLSTTQILSGMAAPPPSRNGSCEL